MKQKRLEFITSKNKKIYSELQNILKKQTKINGELIHLFENCHLRRSKRLFAKNNTIDKTCIICLEDVHEEPEKIIKLECCRKCVHKRCIFQFVLQSNSNINCPHCRSVEPANKIEQIYREMVNEFVSLTENIRNDEFYINNIRDFVTNNIKKKEMVYWENVRLIYGDIYKKINQNSTVGLEYHYMR